jgi:hypothetical protein
LFKKKYIKNTFLKIYIYSMLISVPSSSGRMGLFGTFLLVCLINWPRWVSAGVEAAMSVPMASS